MSAKRYADGPLSSASTATAVTPHNTNEVVANNTFCRALYIGTAGDLAVTMADGGNVTFVGLTAGSLLDIQVSHVRATGTTASNIVALF